MSYADGMRLFDSDLNKLLEAKKGYGVISGLAVTERGAGQNSSVDVASGVAYVNGSYYYFSSTTNVVLTNADGSNPRKDIIIINSTGTITKVDGVAEASQPTGQTGTDTFRPKPPDITANAIILAEAWRATGDNTVADADITDRRVFVKAQKFSSNYIIFKDGSTYYAMDEDGNVDYSGTNAATVINNAFGVLSGGSYYRKVTLKGSV